MRSVRVIFVVVLIITSFLFVGCDGDDALTEQKAVEVANGIITEDFPDLINAVRTVRSYVSEGREFYEVTYSGSAAVVVEGGKTIQIPRIVVVIIDEDTGEKFVAESD